MQMTTLTLGLYETNCYIIYDETTKTAVLTDPGYEPERILNKLDALGLTLKAILFTHGHFDHVGASQAIIDATGCKAYVHERELTMPAYLHRGLTYTDFYGEGDVLSFDSLRFTVLHTPGHTPGSVTLMLDDKLFCGDLLFRGSCGRTDSPGGSWEQMLDSLKRVAELDGDYAIYPGHGAPLQLSKERRENVFILRALGKTTRPGL